MSSDQTWVEALNISPESLSQWTMLAPTGTPLLVWCMTTGHVSPEKYLSWATEHFGLAVLDSKFFAEKFNKGSLDEYRGQLEWSPWFYPVGQWDGVIFVACAEPASEMPPGDYAFLLADPNAMFEAWGTEETKSAVVLEMPQGISLEAVGTSPSTPIPSAPTFVLNLDDDIMSAPEYAPSEAPAEPKEELTGITLSVIHVGEKPAAPASVKPTAPPKISLREEAPPKAAPPAPPPAPAAKPSAKPVDITATFERLHEMYESVMVMRYEEGHAQPYKWDKHLPISEGDGKYNVNLSYPGFLRIVAKTMQPYHGYVIDSPAHREFFENMNVKDLPACVSAIPLKTGEKLWGILVAWGGIGAKPPEALNEALAVAEKITIGLGLNEIKAA